MSKAASTPLGYLMDMLYIQGTQLAKIVHVDRTVISRWKNGRSALNMKSNYFDDVVTALLDINEQQGLQTLERFFSSLSHKTIQKRKDLQKQVATWLVSRDFDQQYRDQDTSNSLYNATYKIYKGASGKRDALHYFWNVLNTLPGGDTAWGYDIDPEAMLHADANLKTARDKMLQSQQQNNTVIMVYLNRPFHEIFRVYKHSLPVFLSKRSAIHYTYNLEAPFYDYIYSIKGKMALVGCNHGKDKNNQYTVIYDDPMTLQQIDAFLEGMLLNFNPLLYPLDSPDITQDFKNESIANYANTPKDQYIVMEEIPFLSFSQQTIDGLLRTLQLDFAEERKLQAYCKISNLQSKKFFVENKFSRIILNHAAIQKLYENKVTEVPLLSSLMGRPIKVRSKYLLDELLSFIGQAEDNRSLEIAVRPVGADAFLPNLNVWTKKDSLVYFYPTENASYRLYSDEFISTTAFYDALDAYWNRLPFECKQPNWIRARLGVPD